MSMDIYEKLARLEKPIRVGVAGAGEFSLEMISQISYVRNMEVSVIGDLNVDAGIRAFMDAGYSREDIAIADSVAAIKKYTALGKRVVVEDALLMCESDADVLCDITGDPCFGAEFGYKSIQNGKHTVVVNIESDVVVGPILRRLADKAGVVYTEGDGDQPSLIKGLYDWARVLGLEVTVAGKWTHLYPGAKETGKRSDIGYLDGSKNQVEMCCVANMTGLVPDICGLHAPSLTLDDIVKTFCLKQQGGIFSRNGVVDVVNCIAPDGKSVIEHKLGGGVFIIINTDNPHTRHAIKSKGFISDAEGSRALIYRPYHFVGVETPISIAKAVLYGEATGAVLPTPVADVVAIAKKDLAPGETLDGIGGFCVRGVIENISTARESNFLPLGLAENVKVNRHIKKGTFLTYDMLEKPGEDFIWKLRRMQDETVF